MPSVARDKQWPVVSPSLNASEDRYWKQYQRAAVSTHVGAISNIDFTATHPFHFAATCSTRVLLFDGSRMVRQLTRFKDTAYSGTYRSDGRLLVAGGASGVVQVFDTSSRALLRQFKGHRQPVHVARFGSDKLHVLSAGDDATVRWWDVTQGSQLQQLKGHTDYVRAACINPSDAQSWATGSYDHTCKVWDMRSSAAATTVSHGAPIEALTFNPSGSTLVTAGGSSLCVWDMLSGGRLMARVGRHRNTITSVLMCTLPDAAGPRLLAGDLNSDLKVYDCDCFQVTHSFKYPAAVTSVGMSPDCRTLAVGLANGLLSVKQAKAPPSRRAIARTQPRYRPSQSDFEVKASLQPEYGPTGQPTDRRRFLRSESGQQSGIHSRHRGARSAAHHPMDQISDDGSSSVATVEAQLQQFKRQLKSPNRLGSAILMLHHLLDNNASWMGTHSGVTRLIRDIRQQLRAEAKTQNKLRHLQSMVLQLTSVHN